MSGVVRRTAADVRGVVIRFLLRAGVVLLVVVVCLLAPRSFGEFTDGSDRGNGVDLTASGQNVEFRQVAEEKATAAVATESTAPDTTTTTVAEATVATDGVLTGRFDVAAHSAFVTVAPEHAGVSGVRLQRETYDAFVRLYEAALADGVRLTIISGTRTFARQKGIWERKWNGQTTVGGEDLSQSIPDPVARAAKIMEYTAMPGTSRHHWGTDIDLNSVDPAWFESGEGREIFDWLTANAAEFGFCQPYSLKGDGRSSGHSEERWHWSYIPLARQFMAEAEQLRDVDIVGFDGHDVATDIGVVANYVQGVDPACR